jgi:hypothetical protein
VDDECAEFRSFFAEDAGRDAIHGARQVWFGLGFVDRRVGSSAQNHIRLGLTDGSAD